MIRITLLASLLASTLGVAGCQTTTDAPGPSLADIAAMNFATGAWPASLARGSQCGAHDASYYRRIGAARSIAERDAAFESLGYRLVPHPRKPGRRSIADSMPRSVRIDYHASSSAFSGDMDPHDVKAMACFAQHAAS